MGLPPVLAGLLVYLLISRKGPFGYASLLFSPAAMIIAQVLLVFPIICGLIINASVVKGKVVYEALYTLNSRKEWMLRYLTSELRYQILGAVSAGFGRAISEVGAIMLVGGNIEHKTRTLTTFIVLQTGMGNFERAIAAGIVLLMIACFINVLIDKTTRGEKL
jgi:tungstate transport system permease protein